MIRKFFYLSVALLAFGIGSSAVFEFYVKTVGQPLIVEKIEALERLQNNTVKNDSPIPSDEQILKWKMDSFEPIIAKWLDKKKIKQYVELKRNDEWAGVTEHEAQVKLIDVNSDNVEELFIQTGCSMVGNCELWIFKKYMHGYNEILKAEMVQSFKLRKSKTKSYFDLEITSHGNSSSGGIAVYKFDRDEYKIDECFGYEYEVITKKNGESLYTKNGQMITKDKPTLTSASCKSWTTEP
jgi:hypothetical protein